MNRIALTLAVAAAALVAGCNQEDHTIVAGGPDETDPAAAELEANGQVQLPPSIASTKTYRCDGNKIVSVDWMSDGSANIRADEERAHVTAGEEGGPLTSPNGYQVTGTSDASSVKIAFPGGSAVSCKA